MFLNELLELLEAHLASRRRDEVDAMVEEQDNLKETISINTRSNTKERPEDRYISITSIRNTQCLVS